MSLPAYTFNGVYKELQKHFGSSVQNYIVAARLTQGYEQLSASTEEQRLDVIKRWQATQLELRKEKDLIKHNGLQQQSHCVFVRVKHATQANLEEKRKQAKNGNLHQDAGFPNQTSSARKTTASTTPSFRESEPNSTLLQTDGVTFEEAIQQSVRATSNGDAQQDTMIERAIRASVMELRAAAKSSNESQAIQRAIQASLAEAGRARNANSSSNESALTDHDDELLSALKQSMSFSQPNLEDGKASMYDDSGIDTDDDENFKMAIERSKSDLVPLQRKDGRSHMNAEQSHLDPDRSKQASERARMEEEIMLEYAKKQSLLEEEHQQAIAALHSRADAAP
ncbi:MAG: hypothetical protein Q9182_007507 [Xanthomendoza sp. 2 TL-2023]